MPWRPSVWSVAAGLPVRPLLAATSRLSSPVPREVGRRASARFGRLWRVPRPGGPLPTSPRNTRGEENFDLLGATYSETLIPLQTTPPVICLPLPQGVLGERVGGEGARRGPTPPPAAHAESGRRPLPPPPYHHLPPPRAALGARPRGCRRSGTGRGRRPTPRAPAPPPAAPASARPGASGRRSRR